MDFPGMIQLVAQLGTMGPFVAYLIWRDMQRDKQLAAERKEQAQIDKDDIAARTELASSLTGLSMIIQARWGGNV